MLCFFGEDIGAGRDLARIGEADQVFLHGKSRFNEQVGDQVRSEIGIGDGIAGDKKNVDQQFLVACVKTDKKRSPRRGHPAHFTESGEKLGHPNLLDL